jgi:hypothetical protein
MPLETLDAINELLFGEKETAYNMVAEAQRKIDPELLGDGAKGLTRRDFETPQKRGRRPPTGMSLDNDDPWPAGRHSFVEGEDGDATWERWEASLNHCTMRINRSDQKKLESVRKWHKCSLLPKFGKHHESR